MWLIIFFLLTKTTFASGEYFDFLPENYVLNSQNQVEVEFHYKISKTPEERFLIRPKVSRGIVKTINKEDALPSFLWSYAPTLDKNMTFQVTGLGKQSTELSFEVLDTKTNELYETKTRKVWGHGLFLDYIKRLNARILDLP